MPAIASNSFRRQLRQRAFSLLEVIVVMGLLSFIILGLMMMFSQVQQAYKLGTTQVDVLESGRLVTDMINRDLAQMTPSRGSNSVNFYFQLTNNPNLPLVQELSGTSPAGRTNLIGDLFFLKLENQRWSGIGYSVLGASNGMGTLYRFETNAPFGQNPALLYYSFFAATPRQMSRLVEGVVHFNVRAFDTNGVWITTTNGPATRIRDTSVFWPPSANLLGVGEVEFYRMASNTVPAAVEVELGVLEDAAIAKAKAYLVINPPTPAMLASQRAYLTNQASRVHVFRTRLPVRNVDSTAYQ